MDTVAKAALRHFVTTNTQAQQAEKIITATQARQNADCLNAADPIAARAALDAMRARAEADRANATPPTPAEVRALLDSCTPPLSAYAAAALIGITARQMQNVLAGTRDLNAPSWLALRVTLSAKARKGLPKPVAP